MPKAQLRIIPSEGAEAFLHKFGSRKDIIDILKAMGINSSPQLITNWKRFGIPKRAFDALNLMVENEEKLNLLTHKGYLEVYYKGIAIGQFHLAKDVQLVINRPRQIVSGKEINVAEEVNRILGGKENG